MVGMTNTQLPAAITVEGLTKKYGRTTVVDHVAFDVPAGSVSGLVGPNGAGKTTIMAMLLGLVRPSGGTATVLGSPITRPGDYLSRVGALIEYPAFYPALSGQQNLVHLCRLGGHDPAGLNELLEMVSLTERAGDRFGSYSMGMKQRLGIAAALIGDPDLVVLDEPTHGVDPQGMRDVREIIRRIAAQGRTVLVSSHLLAELEAVCDHLVVLDRGGCRYAGPIERLGSADAGSIVAAAAAPAEVLVDALVLAGLRARPFDAGRVVVEVVGQDPASVAAAANGAAYAAGIVLSELHHVSSTLEDRVLGLVSTGGQR